MGIATRLTCFAIITSIEEDIRSLIIQHIKTEILVDNNMKERIVNRMSKDLNSQVGLNDFDAIDMLPYSDMGDLVQILNRKKSEIPDIEKEVIASVAKILTLIIPARNRVCHTRPLEVMDFSMIFDAAIGLLELVPVLMISTKKCLDLLEINPSFLSTLSIPSYWQPDDTEIIHNLPIGEFDDTGFIGRKKERENLTKLLLSAHPVINVTGKGGVGKTALVIKTLYDLLESDFKNFKYIVWVSLKTSMLTPQGIIKLKDAICDVSGIKSILKNMLLKDESDSIDEIDNVISKMNDFPILVVIDNLETIEDTSILNKFLGAIPYHSKLLITSRVGIGEYEARFPLEDFSPKEAMVLFKRSCEAFQLKELLEMSDNTVNDILKKLYHNPLAIKWYVSNISLGQNVDFIETCPEKFEDLLTFCFSSMFDRLPIESLLVLYTLIYTPSPLTEPEITFISTINDRAIVNKIIRSLFASNLIQRVYQEGSQSSSSVMAYITSNICKDYVKQFNKISQDIKDKVQLKYKEFYEKIETINVQKNTYWYDPSAIEITSPEQKISAVLLLNALSYLRLKNAKKAIEYIEQAKTLTPNYIDCYTINAYYYIVSQDYNLARQEYISALEINPKSSKLLFYYAIFCRKYLNDLNEAVHHIEKAIENSPFGENDVLLGEKANILTWIGKPEEAITIFEKILKKISRDETRKIRITTDLFAEAYRRTAEKYMKKDDSKKACENLNKGINMIFDLLLKQNKDTYLVRRLFRLMGDLMAICLKVKDTLLVDEAKKNIQKCFDFGINEIETIKFYKYFQDNYGKRLEPTTVSAPNRGVVKFYNKEKAFGFICYPKGEIYFNKYGLANTNDIERIDANISVSFLTKVAKKGLEAINITIDE